MKLLIVRHGDPDYTIEFTDRKRLERGQVSRTETVEAGDKRFLCFSSGKSKRYSLLHPEKNEPHTTECDG